MLLVNNTSGFKHPYTALNAERQLYWEALTALYQKPDSKIAKDEYRRPVLTWVPSGTAAGEAVPSEPRY